MKHLRKILKIIFLFSLIFYVVTLFIKPPLPDKEQILSGFKDHEPIQKEIDEKQFDIKLNDTNYKITPLYNYEIKGLVVAEYDSNDWLDRTHENDTGQTKDLCIVVGKSLDNGSYKEASYKHGEFTCFYTPKRSDLAKNFKLDELSNNHLLPINEELEKSVKNAHIGDQVKIKGKLINYEVIDESGNPIGSRNTSTTREDRLCEIILVSEFKVLKESQIPLHEIRSIAGITALMSGLVLVGLFFLVP